MRLVEQSAVQVRQIARGIFDLDRASYKMRPFVVLAADTSAGIAQLVEHLLAKVWFSVGKT